MKGNRQTYPTIEEVIDGVCMDLGEGNHRKEQYLHWGIREAEDWKSDMAKEVKTVKLSLTPWKSIILPSDCIDWIKVGIQDGDVIKAFVNRNDTAIYHDLDDNNQKIVNPEPSSAASTQVPIVVQFFNYSGWENEGKIFGLVEKDNNFGYFTENRNENADEIQFRTKVSSTSPIYLEYLADGWNPGSQTLVHPYAKELITLGVHYRRLKFDKANGKRSITDTDVERAKRDRDLEYGNVINRMWDYSVEDINEALNGGYGLAPRPQ